MWIWIPCYLLIVKFYTISFEFDTSGKSSFKQIIFLLYFNQKQYQISEKKYADFSFLSFQSNTNHPEISSKTIP